MDDGILNLHLELFGLDVTNAVMRSCGPGGVGPGPHDRMTAFCNLHSSAMHLHSQSAVH